MNIAVIGAWHNAHVTAACLASIGHHVTLVNPGREPWTEYPKLGIVEPELDELVARSASRLGFANLGDAPPHEIVWLAIDTPLRQDGSPDVTELRVVLDRIRQPAQILVISSQVPVGFCQSVERSGCSVVHVPENMQLGRAVRGFLSPDRIVIGATDKAAGDLVETLMYPAPEHPEIRLERRSRTVRCDLPTAEMIKHGTNAFLASSVSLANELAMVGEQYGADMQLVGKALKLDSRIGRKAYVRPGYGFGGGHLARDLYALRAASSSDLPLINAVLRVNDSVTEHVAKTAVSMLPPLQRTLAILGYTYKADTDTLEGSPVKRLATRIRRIGRGAGGDVNVIGHDPRFDGRLDELSALDDYEDKQFGLSHPTHMPWNALERKPDLPGGVGLFLVVTPLPAFKRLDWSRCAPAVVYDLCDGVDRAAVLAAGLSYKAIWQPTEIP